MGTARSSPIRVLLVDDHKLLTDALAGLLGHTDDIEVVGVASTVAEAKSAALEPLDVALMDYLLPDGTGAEATREIKRHWPDAKVVILTAVADDETMLDAVEAGADGYLTKDRAGVEVVQAVRDAHAGEMLLPRAVAYELAQRVGATRKVPTDPVHVHDLTPRELEVLRMLVAGRSSRDICGELYIAPNTLRTHVQNVLAKLRVHSKLEA
ncbi:MAG TPA: response regulator transcription factor, partial [Candidatus Limnocylindrales bacterium]|nr:response regulator transcription factor [Candidatus Limnocylindrales bacterium]